MGFLPKGPFTQRAEKQETFFLRKRPPPNLDIRKTVKTLDPFVPVLVSRLDSNKVYPRSFHSLPEGLLSFLDIFSLRVLQEPCKEANLPCLEKNGIQGTPPRAEKGLLEKPKESKKDLFAPTLVLLFVFKTWGSTFPSTFRLIFLPFSVLSTVCSSSILINSLDMMMKGRSFSCPQLR